MDSATVSRIEEWDSRPVPGGYVGLSELAETEFTGVVESGGARLFMTSGRVVGVVDGALSAFEGGEATAYEAPDPALPLLFAMRARDGEVRGSYYTDDTPIGEVDDTLSEGGFTGYLELSENVLSGDYYVVYYGGRSLSVAFVGNEGRVVTGDDAFQLAADEVGIYQVRAVDLEVTDVPEAPEGAPAAAAVDAEPPDDAVTDDVDGDESAPPAEEEPTAGVADAVDDAPMAEAEEEPPAEETDSVDDVPVAEAEPEPSATGAESDDLGESEDPVGEPNSGGDADVESAPVEGTAVERSSPGPSAGGSGEAPAGAGGASTQGEPDERFEEEARWREARTVPALDPDESEGPEEASPEDGPREAPPEPSPAEPASGEGVDAQEERIGRLQAELESKERERRQLVERVESAEADREELLEERDALAEQVEELESRLEAATAAAGAGGGSGGSAPAGRTLDPATALDQTDLFVRYRSKGDPTLATAHDGRAGAEEVSENLRIESHSRFDADTATVGGQPFDAFLGGTIQHRFVTWLIEELLYEIRETGTEGGLRALYDVLPDIDRAEFDGIVATRDEEEGETHSADFDVICRDRMGKPLVVANINDSLDPATGDMMASLVEDATVVAEGHPSIGAAFLVTASFFQPDALETAAEATRAGGFLSRDSKKSFVKLSRNGGYHLCLVEARGSDFHVAVPDF